MFFGWSARVTRLACLGFEASLSSCFVEADSALPRGWDELGVKSGARRSTGGRASRRLKADSERCLLHDGRIVSCKQAARHGVVIFDQAERLRCAAKLFRRDPKLVGLARLGLSSNWANREHACLQVDRQQERGRCVVLLKYSNVARGRLWPHALTNTNSDQKAGSQSSRS